MDLAHRARRHPEPLTDGTDRPARFHGLDQPHTQIFRQRSGHGSLPAVLHLPSLLPHTPTSGSPLARPARSISRGSKPALARRTGGWRRAWATGWRCSAGTSWGHRSWGLGYPRSAMNGAWVEAWTGRKQACLLRPRPRGGTAGSCGRHNGVGGPGRAQRDHALVGNRHAGSAPGGARDRSRIPVPLTTRGGCGAYASFGSIRSIVPGTHGLRGLELGNRCTSYPRRSAAHRLPPRSRRQYGISAEPEVV